MNYEILNKKCKFIVLIAFLLWDCRRVLKYSLVSFYICFFFLVFSRLTTAPKEAVTSKTLQRATLSVVFEQGQLTEM